MLWPSSTSGSRSRMMREHSTSSSASESWAPESTVVKPVESAIAIAMIRSDSRAAFGNSNPAAGGDLDVERHPPQVPEGHAEERGAARGQQELVGRIGEEAVGRVRGSRALAGGAQAVVPRAQGLRPGGELGEPAVGAVPVERGHLELALPALEEIGIGQEQEGPEGLLGDDHPIRAAGVDRDVALRRAEREQPPGAGVPEEQGIVVERERDRGQLRRPRSRCSSRRAVT